jgi:putative transposon-encoded protein
MSTKRVIEKTVIIQMEGYEIIEKTAKASGTTARVLVPRHWIGKKVRIVRLEP